jgi:mRNA-degrading endonuclease RelE of RelBE toxin-antitoxin system
VSPPFRIEYVASAVDDIKGLRAFDRAKIIEAIDRHLTSAPSQPSRSRIKRMTQPFWSQFRLRVDDLRVYYDVDETDRHVTVLRVLRKGSSPTPEQP